MELAFSRSRAALLRRQGLVFPPEPGGVGDARLARAASVELSVLGHVPSERLLARWERISPVELAASLEHTRRTLAVGRGASETHEPLFRSFPDGIPDDTEALYWQKVLAHFLQGEGQPCLFCRKVGTTHVLSPCRHVVCDRCFDGGSYSACPVCEHAVDRTSPFFRPSPAREPSEEEHVRFALVDLGEDLLASARALFGAFCVRNQPLSPVDREDFEVLIGDFRAEVFDWLPEEIPLRENRALIVASLLRAAPLAQVWPLAKKHLTTPTDVLRMLAAFSGADASLQPALAFKIYPLEEVPRRFFGARAKGLRAGWGNDGAQTAVCIPIQMRRFQVAKLPRPLRREVLGLLEGFDEGSLIEEMLRHPSLWVWVGQFLHPHEYADRFPTVARGFAVVRKKAKDGTKAPPFVTYYGKLDRAIRAGDAGGMLALLRARPGELARRFDHLLRMSAGDEAAIRAALEAFERSTPKLATPILLTLRNLLPLRARRPAPRRLFWPKGSVAKGVSRADGRPPLPEGLIADVVAGIERELLDRLAKKPRFDTFILDEALGRVPAPFNARTQSPSAVDLTRGAVVPISQSKQVRLFLHWCEPEEGHSTDLDLSVAFYDAEWGYRGVCAYHALKFTGEAGEAIATSSGDLRSAPFPDGASEFVDLDRVSARKNGLRYAVMVVTAYAGLSFSKLERAYAGLMLRDDLQGAHFDPRTVELKFALQGGNGVFAPLVLDLEADRLHWLDVYSEGELAMNTAEGAHGQLSKLCPTLIDYFATGTRMSLFELASLHAAARGQEVLVRADDAKGTGKLFIRRSDERPAAFLGRLRSGHADRTVDSASEPKGAPVFAALYRGDLTLPEGSDCYALFREKCTPNLSAGDLVA